ncbi:MAG: exo-alpha-sialidase [Opitutaceae bacterium]|nr:exo-alpha-sialidase [Opitutaceae bacterium]
MIDGIPGSFGSGQIVEVRPGRLLLIATWYDRRDPERPLFDPVTEGLLASRQVKAVSTDEGETWTPWETIRLPASLAGCSSTGPIVRWPDGTLAFPFESLKAYDDPQPAVPGAWCLLSRDEGRTFGEPVLIARDAGNQRYYWDQRWCAASGYRQFIALFWTHDVSAKCDLSVHLLRGGLDSPVNPNAPIDTGLTGQIAAPLLLEDGRLAAFVVERGQPSRLVLWLSPDGGRTWPEMLVIYAHEERGRMSQGENDIDYAEYWEDMHRWTFGHPAICALDGGELLLSYYAGVPNQLSLYWAKVKL